MSECENDYLISYGANNYSTIKSKKKRFTFDLKDVSLLDSLTEKYTSEESWNDDIGTSYKLKSKTDGETLIMKVAIQPVDEAYATMYYHKFFSHYNFGTNRGIMVDPDSKDVLVDYVNGDLDDFTIDLFKQNSQKDPKINIKYATCTEHFDGTVIDYINDMDNDLSIVKNNLEQYIRRLTEFMKQSGVLCLELKLENIFVSWKNKKTHEFMIGDFGLCCNTRNTRNAAFQFIKCDINRKDYPEYHFVHYMLLSVNFYTISKFRHDFDGTFLFKPELKQLKNKLEKGRWKRLQLKRLIENGMSEYCENIIYSAAMTDKSRRPDVIQVFFEVINL